MQELLKTKHHHITALTRTTSKAQIPKGVRRVEVDYDDEHSLVNALHGQEVLIITLSVNAPPDTHSKLVKAAVKAHVPYIVPNAYGGDVELQSFMDDKLYGNSVFRNVDEIRQLGAKPLALVCGFWYEWSLARGENHFGFDIKGRKVTFYDDGMYKMTVSTWNQCGRALARLLKLPIHGGDVSLDHFKHTAIYFCSFKVSQRDILDSLNRVLHTKDSDWQIQHESTKQRFEDGMKEMQQGQRSGFAKAMYAKGFMPGSGTDFEYRGLANDFLHLPKESLDEATERAVEMVENGTLVS